MNPVPRRASAFKNNPEQRLQVLHSKIDEFERMTNPTAKTNKLQNDIKDKIDKWTFDNYTLESPLQLTKEQVFETIDALAGRTT